MISEFASLEQSPDAASRRIPAGARHARILELVDRDGFVSVGEIA